MNRNLIRKSPGFVPYGVKSEFSGEIPQLSCPVCDVTWSPLTFDLCTRDTAQWWPTYNRKSWPQCQINVNHRRFLTSCRIEVWNFSLLVHGAEYRITCMFVSGLMRCRRMLMSHGYVTRGRHIILLSRCYISLSHVADKCRCHVSLSYS